MAFPLDHIQLGAPAYGPRKSSVGICWHTTESNGQDLATAKNTAAWQATPGNSSGGSYNWIIGTDGLVLTVPYLEASGGIAPVANRHPRSAFPWILDTLGEAVFADPNAHLLNVALSGRTADFMASGYPDSMVDQAARLVLWVEAQPWGADDLVLTGHLNWNTNRTDPGEGFIPLVLARYAELTAPATPIPTPTPSMPPPETPAQREARLADEVVKLRAAHPEAAQRWVMNTGMTQAIDGQPLTRERRLSAEVTFLREVAAT